MKPSSFRGTPFRGIPAETLLVILVVALLCTIVASGPSPTGPLNHSLRGLPDRPDRDDPEHLEFQHPRPRPVTADIRTLLMEKKPD